MTPRLLAGWWKTKWSRRFHRLLDPANDGLSGLKVWSLCNQCFARDWLIKEVTPARRCLPCQRLEQKWSAP